MIQLHPRPGQSRALLLVPRRRHQLRPRRCHLLAGQDAGHMCSMTGFVDQRIAGAISEVHMLQLARQVGVAMSGEMRVVRLDSRVEHGPDDSLAGRLEGALRRVGLRGDDTPMDEIVDLEVRPHAIDGVPRRGTRSRCRRRVGGIMWGAQTEILGSHVGLAVRLHELADLARGETSRHVVGHGGLPSSDECPRRDLRQPTKHIGRCAGHALRVARTQFDDDPDRGSRCGLGHELGERARHDGVSHEIGCCRHRPARAGQTPLASWRRAERLSGNARQVSHSVLTR